VGLRDEFERYLLQQAKYPGGEIHGDWSDKIKTSFRPGWQSIRKSSPCRKKKLKNTWRKKGIDAAFKIAIDACNFATSFTAWVFEKVLFSIKVE
jgi:hypothetical protein